eukprot:jgi/Mesen1/10413/ME000818S09893
MLVGFKEFLSSGTQRQVCTTRARERPAAERAPYRFSGHKRPISGHRRPNIHRKQQQQQQRRQQQKQQQTSNRISRVAQAGTMGVCLSRDRVSKSVADCDDQSEGSSSYATTSYTHSGSQPGGNHSGVDQQSHKQQEQHKKHQPQHKPEGPGGALRAAALCGTTTTTTTTAAAAAARKALPLPPPPTAIPAPPSLPSSTGSGVTSLSGGSSSLSPAESLRNPLSNAVLALAHSRSASQASLAGSGSSLHEGSGGSGAILRSASLASLAGSGSLVDGGGCGSGGGQATKFFRPNLMLGEGGFGKVYLGELDARTSHKQVVAVKKLNQGGMQGHREWLAEVNILGLLQHNNLVSLIGYCADNACGERSLVYEFMPMGSLERHLFCQDDSLPTLRWDVRVKIALEAAMGLAYLHDEQQHQQFIYRDFKASNVLLDHDFTVKLSDFGLAREGPEAGDTHMTTAVMGTYGYTAPEYLMKGLASFLLLMLLLLLLLPLAVTMHSLYGVVLLEIMTGLPSMDRARPAGKKNLVEWAKPFLADRRRLYKLIDARLEGEYSIRAAQVLADVVQHCLSFDPRARPSMDNVVDELAGLAALTELAVEPAADDNGGGGGGLSASSSIALERATGPLSTQSLVLRYGCGCSRRLYLRPGCPLHLGVGSVVVIISLAHVRHRAVSLVLQPQQCPQSCGQGGLQQLSLQRRAMIDPPATFSCRRRSGHFAISKLSSPRTLGGGGGVQRRPQKLQQGRRSGSCRWVVRTCARARMQACVHACGESRQQQQPLTSVSLRCTALDCLSVHICS